MAAAGKRLRYAKGPPRPRYLSGADADRAVMMILALAAEVAVLRDRLDTHERLAESDERAATAAVEDYEPSPAVEAARHAARRALIDRITRVLLEPQAERNTPGATGGPQD